MYKFFLLFSLFFGILLGNFSSAFASITSDKCVNDGGRYTLSNGVGTCTIGGRTCDEWSYYNGTCSTSNYSSVCTKELRYCSNGSAMPRDADCTWRSDLCSPSSSTTCTNEYSPVCGQTYSCSGGYCSQNISQTYMNMCYLQKAGASYLSNGACQSSCSYQNGYWTCGQTYTCTQEARYCADGSVMKRDADCTWRSDLCPSCTSEYVPVCARSGSCTGSSCPTSQTYQNACRANTANATILYYGACIEMSSICSSEIRYCSDGSRMLRGTDCTWRSDLCTSSSSSSSYYSTDPYTFAYNNGLTSISRELFRPGDSISRQESTKMFIATIQLFNNGNSIYETVDCSSAFRDEYSFDSSLASSVYKMCGLGLMRGNNGYFSPSSSLTHSEARLILSRILRLTGYTYLEDEISTMNPNTPIPRWELVSWIYMLYNRR